MSNLCSKNIVTKFQPLSSQSAQGDNRNLGLARLPGLEKLTEIVIGLTVNCLNIIPLALLDKNDKNSSYVKMSGKPYLKTLWWNLVCSFVIWKISRRPNFSEIGGSRNMTDRRRSSCLSTGSYNTVSRNILLLVQRRIFLFYVNQKNLENVTIWSTNGQKVISFE